MAANARLRTRVEEIQAKAEPEREWWNKRREVLRAEFMKELDREAAAGKKGEKDAPPDKSHNPAKTESVAGSTGSEEDGVWVEEGGPTSPTSPPVQGSTAPASGGGGGGGGKKKRKGRK